ncbi:hypothetical protein CCACVL1_14718 [Corchorus capsularis]|uniref:Uncharacterized protein n=1 Tax=Corchorus capsularis TaxID=210143 RepID=A0A1R3I5V0_COCAP|nr:hypothetical protein CCACVL1_14718 [Corchorus capsularis]
MAECSTWSQTLLRVQCPLKGRISKEADVLHLYDIKEVVISSQKRLTSPISGNHVRPLTNHRNKGYTIARLNITISSGPIFPSNSERSYSG